MSDALDRGFSVTESAPMDEPITAPAHSTAAFVGRALRGPLETPTTVYNVADFRRVFGGFCDGSGLGFAVEQFFAHGGRRAIVVRVANGARGAMLCLPALHGVLVLDAVEPGSAEHVRASIDYDGIDAADQARFNLTIQRISQDTHFVLDQEIHQKVSCLAGDERNVADVLLTSALVRARGPLPSHRPLATDAEYVDPAQPGTDGAALTDYDLVGSATDGHGIFALDPVDQFELLYLPPPAADRTPGPAAVLAAELYCHKRGAMLILDPPAGWRTPGDAITAMRDPANANPDVLTYFPRVRQREQASSEWLPIGGAIAGLLCKLDRLRGPWEDLDQRGFALDRDLVPALGVDHDDAHQLVKSGVNVVAGMTAGQTMICGSVTLGRAVHVDSEYGSLTTRRLCLAVTNAVDRATRWAVFQSQDSATGHRIVTRVHRYMSELADAGAFENDHFVVQCDLGNRRQASGFSVMLAFHPVNAPQPVALTVHQSLAGTRVSTTAFAPARARAIAMPPAPG